MCDQYVCFVDVILTVGRPPWLMPQCFGRDRRRRFDATTLADDTKVLDIPNLWPELAAQPKILHGLCVGKFDWVNKVQWFSQMGKVATYGQWYHGCPWEYVILNDWEQSISVPLIYWYHESFLCQLHQIPTALLPINAHNCIFCKWSRFHLSQPTPPIHRTAIFQFVWFKCCSTYKLLLGMKIS